MSNQPRVILLDDRCELPDGSYMGEWQDYTVSVLYLSPNHRCEIDLQTAACCPALSRYVSIDVRNGRALVTET